MVIGLIKINVLNMHQSVNKDIIMMKVITHHNVNHVWKIVILVNININVLRV